MDQSQFNKFSDGARTILLSAQSLAMSSGVDTDTGHILLAILLHSDSVAKGILTTQNILVENIENAIGIHKDAIAHATSNREPNLTNDCKSVLTKAINISSGYGHVSVDIEHLLLAVVSSPNYQSYKAIQQLGVSPEKIHDQLINLFQELMQFEMAQKNTEESDDSFASVGVPEQNLPKNRRNSTSGALEFFSSDLTSAAASGKLDPVIGREEEIDRAIQILSRRTKNNPVLLGEPGVGKTAIAEGIAQKIADGNVPANLLGKRVLSLDLASMVAGTIYRGQFEERIKKVLDDLAKLNDAILFIDELHTIIGAGSAEGSLDAAQILKPSLAKGVVKVIGATTLEEYRKHIEKDAALSRRFQPIIVNEPSTLDTIEILKGIRPQYEKFHRIHISDEAIYTAVKLSQTYINDRFLPDKAIDLIDEASAAVKTRDKRFNKLVLYNQQIEKISASKDAAVAKEQYELAAKLQDKENSIKTLLAKAQEKAGQIKLATVDSENIAAVVSRSTGIPAASLNPEEALQIKDLEQNLTKFVIGQDEAISAVSKAVRRSRTGISSQSRPIASFIFLGPSGVGKSELAKVIAKVVYGKESALIKIDMSEFMEKHNTSRLVGAPAGYVGYEDGGKLTETIRRQPYSVVLLDEIEKAHPDVFNILLQILEDGYLTDAKGKRVDFRHTMIIMTSNIGMDELNRNAALGFKSANAASSTQDKYDSLKNDILAKLKDAFRPEFLNRLDQTIVFKPLSQDTIRQIVDLQLAELNARLIENSYKLQIDAAAKKMLVEIAAAEQNGARPVRRIIQNLIEDKLAEAIVNGKMDKRKIINIRREDNQLVLA